LTLFEADDGLAVQPAGDQPARTPVVSAAFLKERPDAITVG
jgi:hypothetical protein